MAQLRHHPILAMGPMHQSRGVNNSELKFKRGASKPSGHQGVATSALPAAGSAAAPGGGPPPPPPAGAAGGGGQQSWREEQHGNELHTLNVAIGANIVIFIAKIWVHIITGSSSMLAEALHSIADVLNQVLLRVGVLKAQQAPTVQHPYGFLRDRFIWSLISAVGIFFLGAGASFIHGLHTLTETRVLHDMEWSYLVLAVSGLLEGYSLWVATRAVIKGAKARGVSVMQHIKNGQDPTTVAVMLEDGGAVMGLIIAGGCTALAHLTGNAMWDAAGSILVGCLLGAIAVFLVQKNRQLLIGRSMSQVEVDQILALLRRDPVVNYITDTKTEEIGPAIYRFKAEVAWNGDRLVDNYLKRCDKERLLQALQRAAQGPNAQVDLERLLKAYGRDIIATVGAEVDRLEYQIMKTNPGIKWVDLETDRGKYLRPGSRDSSAGGTAGGTGSAASSGSSSEYAFADVPSGPSLSSSLASWDEAQYSNSSFDFETEQQLQFVKQQQAAATAAATAMAATDSGSINGVALKLKQQVPWQPGLQPRDPCTSTLDLTAAGTDEATRLKALRNGGSGSSSSSASDASAGTADHVSPGAGR